MMRTRARLSIFSLLFLLLLGVKAEARPIALAWDANTEPNIAGYVVVYGFASRTYTTTVDVGNKTTVTLQNLPDNQPLYFAVKAYNTSNLMSSPSSEVSIPSAGSRISIDSPGNNAMVMQPFSIRGWAADSSSFAGTGVDAVHVYAYPGSMSSTAIFLGPASYGAARTDVASALGGSRFTNTGYALPVTKLKAGTYVFVVYAHSTVTGTWAAATRTIRVGAGPLLNIESPTSGSLVGQPFYVTGWAMDTRAAKGTGVNAVQLFSQPVGGGPVSLLGNATLIYRPDLAATFGSKYGGAGFVIAVTGIPAGQYVLTAKARSTVTNTWIISATTVITSGPLTSIDTPRGPTPVSAGFSISGWSIDLRSTSGPGISAVHVYAYPVTGGSAIFLGAADVNQSRPDVEAIYGAEFENCGYQLPVTQPLSPGKYLFVAFPYSSVSNGFATPYQWTVTVQ